MKFFSNILSILYLLPSIVEDPGFLNCAKEPLRKSDAEIVSFLIFIKLS